MDLEVREADFRRLLGKDKTETIFSGGDVLLGEKEAVRAAEQAKEKVLELLPSVLAQQLRSMVPEGFDVSEISFKCSLSGKPFGIGVSGDINVKFAKK